MSSGIVIIAALHVVKRMGLICSFLCLQRKERKIDTGLAKRGGWGACAFSLPRSAVVSLL